MARGAQQATRGEPKGVPRGRLDEQLMEGEQLAARQRRAPLLDGKGGGRGRRARLVRHQGLCVGQIEPVHTMEMEQSERF